ncbi:MAG: glycerol kinase GlpK, partial [Spirochaetales bacterium]|nr:glycerol kinase GlpK [Spirochaetales bacterium]
MKKYIAALDHGTTSTRCIIFDHQGNTVTQAQKEHRQYYPRPGWVEHDGAEIWQAGADVLSQAVREAGEDDIEAIGITNQRETVLMWDPVTHKPVSRAIVWQDTRTQNMIQGLSENQGPRFFAEKTGLLPAAYFSASKLSWLLGADPERPRKAEKGELLAGTMDSWLLWNLTGGKVHATDVTNASRMLLMDIHSCSWDTELLDLFGIPEAMLPRIMPSIPSSPFGYTADNGPVKGGIPVFGILGDQQAALFGQACFEKGTCKNTYGTGCFTLMPIGSTPLFSHKGLLTTVAWQMAGQPAEYAFEGSVAIAGSLVQWFRDNIGLINESREIEDLAQTVDDNGDVYFVPAFSGLFAPHWRGDARGVITGLTGYANKGHIARAILEATAFQSWEIVDAMERESGSSLSILKVDGGMTANRTLMQFQADL